MIGDSKSRSQSLNREAATLASLIPCYICQLSPAFIRFMCAYQLVMTPVHTDLEVSDGIVVAWDSKDPFASRPAQSQDTIGQEGQDYGYKQGRVGAFLLSHDPLQALAKYRRVECGVLIFQPRAPG